MIIFATKYSHIKKIGKHIISIVLVLAVLLPFAVQFIHSFEHHDHICNSSDLHIDSHEKDCEVYHFKIDQHSIFFPFDLNFKEKPILHHKLELLEVLHVKLELHKKASRAPPTLLL